jgi:hypothetical protein
MALTYRDMDNSNKTPLRIHRASLGTPLRTSLTQAEKFGVSVSVS